MSSKIHLKVRLTFELTGALRYVAKDPELNGGLLAARSNGSG